MIRRLGSKTRAPALLALAAALAVAGCGGGDGGGYGGKGKGAGDSTGSAAYAPPAAPNPEEGATFVSLGNVPKLGLVLVDSKGYTLYDFHKDRGGATACYGSCTRVWPPLLAEGDPHPSNGAKAGLLGTTERRDGTTQVTYAGHPLYTYVADKDPGEASGNGFSAFGGEWHALKASGEEAKD